MGVTAPGPLCPHPVLVTFAYFVHRVYDIVILDGQYKDEHAARRHTLSTGTAHVSGRGEIVCYVPALIWTCCTPHHQVRRQTKTVDILTLPTFTHAVRSLHESLRDPPDVRLAHYSLVSSCESG